MKNLNTAKMYKAMLLLPETHCWCISYVKQIATFPSLCLPFVFPVLILHKKIVSRSEDVMQLQQDSEDKVHLVIILAIRKVLDLPFCDL